MIDDSQIVSQLMIDICSKIGIANYDEYSLINDINENEILNNKTSTLKKVRKSCWKFNLCKWIKFN
jgi:talin